MKVDMSNIRKFQMTHRTDEVIRALLREQGIEIGDNEKLSWNHDLVRRGETHGGHPIRSSYFDGDTDLVLTVYLTSPDETPAQKGSKKKAK